MKSVADDLTADERWQREVLEPADVWGVQDFGRRRRRRPHGHQDPSAARSSACCASCARRLKAAFDLAGIAFAYAGGPTEVVLRDEVPPAPPRHVAPTTTAARACVVPDDPRPTRRLAPTPPRKPARPASAG